MCILPQQQQKRNEVITWMNLENMMLSERKQTQKGHMLYDPTYVKCSERANP